MKKAVVLILSCLPCFVFSQIGGFFTQPTVSSGGGKFNIDGVIGSYNVPAKAYIQYQQNGKTITDSTKLKNGKFHFSGYIDGDPVPATLAFSAKGAGINSTDVKQIYLEKGTISINGTDALATATLTGTKTNEENEQYTAALKPINEAYDVLDKKTNAATTDEQKSEAFVRENYKAEKTIAARELAINQKFIQENPNSYISIHLLEYFAFRGDDYAQIAPLFNSLTPAVKQTEAGKKLAEKLPKLKPLAVGEIAPDFAEADTAGKMVKLSSFRGKYILVDFWASWCGPCRQENPNLVKAYNRYKGQNFTIMGVSLDKPGTKDHWLKAIRNDGINWTQVSDLKFGNDHAALLYGVLGVPQNFLLDPQGKIIAKNLRMRDLEEKLEELFGKM